MCKSILLSSFAITVLIFVSCSTFASAETASQVKDAAVPGLVLNVMGEAVPSTPDYALLEEYIRGAMEDWDVPGLRPILGRRAARLECSISSCSIDKNKAQLSVMKLVTTQTALTRTWPLSAAYGLALTFHLL